MRLNEWNVRLRTDGFERAVREAVPNMIEDIATLKKQNQELASQMVAMADLLNTIGGAAARNIDEIKAMKRTFNQSEQLDREG